MDKTPGAVVMCESEMCLASYCDEHGDGFIVPEKQSCKVNAIDTMFMCSNSQVQNVGKTSCCLVR